MEDTVETSGRIGREGWRTQWRPVEGLTERDGGHRMEDTVQTSGRIGREGWRTQWRPVEGLTERDGGHSGDQWRD
ncbi:unnamed protein product [Staurois parvus]|uniref:Uncharacterized protein n=1 Tax=Staurois parvus TaxID=386267 RepID=A0ABN9D665_9NEOB|nr:unnamed protein product [Staurois parvus]